MRFSIAVVDVVILFFVVVLFSLFSEDQLESAIFVGMEMTRSTEILQNSLYYEYY